MHSKKYFFLTLFMLLMVFACQKEETPVVIDPPAPSEPFTIACTDTLAYTYDQDIQALLITHCSDESCHNAISAQNGLNVHSYNSVKTAINKSTSVFLKRISKEPGVSPMPPNESTKAALNANQVMQVACWIENEMPEN